MKPAREAGLRRLHLSLAIFWIVMLAPALLWWRDSILFVILVSVYALVVSHLAAAAGYTPDAPKEEPAP